MLRMLISAAVVAVLPVVGCERNNAPDGSASTSRAPASPVIPGNDAVAVNEDVIDTFKTSMNDRLDQAEQRIDQIEDLAKALPENERASLQAVVDDLQGRHDALAERVDDLDVKSQSAWEEARASIERSWTDLTQAINSAAERFGLARVPGVAAPGM